MELIFFRLNRTIADTRYTISPAMANNRNMFKMTFVWAKKNFFFQANFDVFFLYFDINPKKKYSSDTRAWTEGIVLSDSR